MKKALLSELYFRELNDKATLETRPTMHVTVLSILGSLLAYAFINFHATSTWQFWWFNTAIGLAAVEYAVAMYNVIRSNVGYEEYERLPPMGEIEAYRSSLDEYFKQNPSAAGSPASDFDSFIRRHMVDAVARNEYANKSRAARHYSAMRAMSICTVFIFVAALPLLWNLRSHQLGGEMTRQDSSGRSAGNPPAGTPTTPSATPAATTNPQASPAAPSTLPPKPPEPQNTIFRGTQQPERPRVPATRPIPTSTPRRRG